MRTLHILNGDSTLNIFNVANIPGDVLVWRETLSEGPVLADSEQHFFSMRATWISKAYQTENLNYREIIIDEFDKLRSYKDYDELIFWFEFDLFCQVNLLFLLSFFKDKYPYEAKLSLICPKSHKNHPDFRGIGQLKPAELSGLISEKKCLTHSDILFAS